MIGTAARTAVVAGTATAVSGNVARRQAAAAQQQAAAAAAASEQRAAAAPAPAPVPAPAPPPAPAPAPAGDRRLEQLTQLAQLKEQGILTDEEFAAEKARILSS